MTNSAPSLFPLWQFVKPFPTGVLHRLVIWQSPASPRQLVVYLGFLAIQSTCTVNWEEDGIFVLNVGTFQANGISSWARAKQWAEWIISDVEALSQPKRARRGVKRNPRLNPDLEKEAA
jgi:hypothetical protein